MAYNHGVAKAIFEAEWKKKAAEYRKHGMPEEKIASMREFEEEVFKSDRKFYEGLTDYILDEHSPDLIYEDTYQINDFMWLDLIEDEEVYKQLMALPKEWLVIFTLNKLEGYTQKELSSIFSTTQQNISLRIGKIAEILKLTCKTADFLG